MSLSVGAKRAERPAFKGQELYSWQVSGTWTYVVLPGTNRNKSWGDLQKAPHWHEDQLRTALSDMAVGEMVFWFNRCEGAGPPLAYPPRQVRQGLLELCEQLGVSLQLPEDLSD